MSAAFVFPEEHVEGLGRRRWTVSDVERLQDIGAFDGERWELIEGDLYDKEGQKPPHLFALESLGVRLVRVYDPAAVRYQIPLQLTGPDGRHSLPEPDVIVLRDPTVRYGFRRPDEVLLVAEISDTSLRMDLTVKSKLYARSGVPEYWVVDVVNRRVVIHRDPTEGAYREIKSFGETESVHTATRPEAALRISDLLPPSQG